MLLTFVNDYTPSKVAGDPFEMMNPSNALSSLWVRRSPWKLKTLANMRAMATFQQRNSSSRVGLQVQIKVSNSDQPSVTLNGRLNAPLGKPNVLGCDP